MSAGNPSTFWYTLHGCGLESAFPIPGLAPRDAPEPGLALSVSRTNHLWEGDESEYAPWRPDDEVPQRPDFRIEYRKGPAGYLIRFRGCADYLVSPDGTGVIAYLTEPDIPQLARDVLVGPILATALLIRGAYALHGSCVTRDGAAMAFIGANGAGKSTLAATFVAEGWELLTDGMFVAKLENSGAWVPPGDPRIRVRPDTAGGLAYLPRFDAEESEGASKYRLAVGDDGWGRFSQAPRPLKLAYILAPGGPDAGVLIEPCMGSDAIMTTLANTYGMNTYHKEFLAPHLKYVEQFLKTVPLRRLQYTKELGNLERMVSAVKRDATPFLTHR